MCHPSGTGDVVRFRCVVLGFYCTHIRTDDIKYNSEDTCPLVLSCDRTRPSVVSTRPNGHKKTFFEALLGIAERMFFRSKPLGRPSIILLQK